MEYLHHFSLSDDPFRSDAGEKYDVELTSQREALARLDRAVRQRKGLVVLVGGVGTGKTRLARELYDGLEEELFEAGMMVVLRREVGGEWLLARIARQLGIEDAEREHEALIREIYERLAIIHEDGRRAVLIFDDAHGLANADALAEVCALVKLEYEDRRLVTVVLVGAPPLDAAIGADPLLAHHVDVRVSLGPLSRDEAADYLAARVEAAGGSAEILLPGASAALYELAEGAPGRINALADNALVEAWLVQHPQLLRSDVERAYRALGWGDVASSSPSAMRSARRAAPAQAESTDPFGFQEQAEADYGATMRASAPGRGKAEATRVLLEDPPPDGPPKRSDEVDDLFMELLDD